MEESLIKGMLYNIAGLKVRINSDDIIMFRPLKSFFEESQDNAEVDLDIVVKPSKKISQPEGQLIIDEDIKWASNDGSYYSNSIFVYDKNTKSLLSKAEVNHDWSKAEITYLKSNAFAKIGVAGYLCDILYRNRVLFKQRVVLNAAAVSWNGQGLVFVAPSGGKTAHALLWVEYMDAQILSDDRPVITIMDDNLDVYGTPWSKKRLFSTGSSPVKAIVILEKSLENKINQLPIKAAVPQVMARCFLPYYDRDIMNLGFNNIEKILTSVPVYQLKCSPDHDAVALLHRVLTKA